jgi:hypothetical protein
MRSIAELFDSMAGESDRYFVPMTKSPPDLRAKNSRLLIDKDGKLSRVATVVLTDSTSYLATKFLDPFQKLEELGRPIPSLLQFSGFVEMETTSGSVIILSTRNISRIE